MVPHKTEIPEYLVIVITGLIGPCQTWAKTKALLAGFRQADEARKDDEWPTGDRPAITR